MAYDTFLINNGVGTDADGVDRINQVGRITRFNHSTSLSIWFDPYANMVNGTDSTLWHPNARKDERIYAFIRDICRSVYLTFNETRRNFVGVDVYHYTLPQTIFSNSTENRGFCMNSTTANKSHELNCLPSGLFTQTPCQHCEPIVLFSIKKQLISITAHLVTGLAADIPLPFIASNPHFLDADPTVLYAVEGMHPDDAIHRSFGDLEPMTG
ncbi:unnamed protein product, partial [Rotaria sp. Silwood2]